MSLKVQKVRRGFLFIIQFQGKTEQRVMKSKQQILLTVLFLVGKGCQTSYDLGDSNSKFKVDYGNDASCSNFSFIECQWYQCAKYSDRGNTSSQCQLYKWYDNSQWDYCTQKFCDPNVKYPQTSTSIEECQAYISGSSTLPLALAITIIVAAAILVSICCCCCYCSCCNSWRQNCCESFKNLLQLLFCCPCIKRRNLYQGEIQKPRLELSSMFQVAMNVYEQPHWRFDSVKNSKLDSACSICLETRPSLELSCGHIFHRQCILAWAQKKQECALCRSSNFDVVTVHCEQCLGSYYKAQLGKFASYLRSNRQVCQQCSRIGNH